MFTAGTDLVLKKFSQKDFAIVATTTHEFVDMAINWYKSLTRVGLDMYALIVCYDRQSHEKLNALDITSTYLDVGEFPRNTDGEWYEMEKRTNHIGACTILSNFKINVIRSETDIFFLKNFLPKFIAEDDFNFDMLVCSDKRYDRFNHKRKKNHIVSVEWGRNNVKDWGLSDQAKYGDINGSLCYLPHRASEKIVKFHNDLADPEYLKQFPVKQYSGSAQRIWNHAVKEKNFKIKILSVFDFTNGSVWKVPYLREHIKDRVYSVHYNFHSNAAPRQRFIEKKAAMIENGHWLL